MKIFLKVTSEIKYVVRAFEILSQVKYYATG